MQRNKRDSVFLIIGRLICLVNIILAIYINNAHVTSRCVGAAWARMALPRGLACHVASTWVPRENKPLFAFNLIVLIDLKSKINSKKSRKIPKNWKIHKF